MQLLYLHLQVQHTLPQRTTGVSTSDKSVDHEFHSVVTTGHMLLGKVAQVHQTLQSSPAVEDTAATYNQPVSSVYAGTVSSMPTHESRNATELQISHAPTIVAIPGQSEDQHQQPLVDSVRCPR